MNFCIEIAPETRAAIAFSQTYARDSMRYQVRTEHLLRATIGCGGAPRLLARTGVDFISLGFELKELSRFGRPGGPAVPPLAPRCQRALSYAYEEAIQMNDRTLMPEHLLLGFACDPESPAGSIFLRFGGSYLWLRRALDDLRLQRLFECPF